MKHKRFVEVDVRFSTEGKLRPLQILFDKIAYGKDPATDWEKTDLEIIIGESLPE